MCPRAHAIRSAEWPQSSSSSRFAPAVASVVTTVAWPSPWQTDGLSEAAEELLSEVLSRGTMASDDRDLDWDAKTRRAAFGAVAERLLCATRDAHTSSGAHSTVVESWEAWAARQEVEDLPDVDDAIAELAAAIKALGGNGVAPWERRR